MAITIVVVASPIGDRGLETTDGSRDADHADLYKGARLGGPFFELDASRTS